MEHFGGVNDEPNCHVKTTWSASVRTKLRLHEHKPLKKNLTKIRNLRRINQSVYLLGQKAQQTKTFQFDSQLEQKGFVCPNAFKPTLPLIPWLFYRMRARGSFQDKKKAAEVLGCIFTQIQRQFWECMRLNLHSNVVWISCWCLRKGGCKLYPYYLNKIDALNILAIIYAQ